MIIAEKCERNRNPEQVYSQLFMFYLFFFFVGLLNVVVGLYIENGS